MNYDAMSHAELVELVKLQHQRIDQQAELIAVLEREAQLAGQVIQARDDSAELRQQLAVVQAKGLIKETANAVTEALLDVLLALDAPTRSNRLRKVKNHRKARHKRVARPGGRPKSTALPLLFVASIAARYGERFDGIRRRQPNGPTRKDAIREAIKAWGALYERLAIPNPLPRPYNIDAIEKQYVRQLRP